MRRAIALSALLLARPAAADPVFTASFEVGEAWNEPLLEESDRDDETVERYEFQEAKFGIAHTLRPGLAAFLDLVRRERSYDVATDRDNAATRIAGRIRWDATEVLRLTLAGAWGTKTYRRANLDNEPASASVVARWRFGVRDNLRLGLSYHETRFDEDPARDRDRRAAFAAWEHPFTDAFSIEVKGEIEDRGFRVPSASRRNTTSRSVRVSLRYDAGND